MSPPDPCPDPDQLSAFHRGDLGPDALDAVGEHLSSCRECEARLAAIDAGNEVVSNLRKFFGREPWVGPEEYRGLERKAKAIPVGDPGDVPTAPPEPPTAPAGLALPARLGKYELIKELGRGGMGVVYAAVHTNLNKRVAVKVILPEYADHPRVVARFRREARAVGELDHPNIVAATDADEADGCPFLVMELVDGLDLVFLLRRVGPLPVADACELIRQAAGGLQYVHEHGRVHRDLKPSNLMLAADGVVKILDLGLAAFRADGPPPGGDLTGSRLMMGTADYTAPEQWADSHRVDIRADVYSLGCTLYHLLVGRAPFAGPEYQSLARKQLAHAEAAPPAARPARPDVPPELDAVLQRMLAKRPEDRFPTPRAVADALAPFTAGADCRKLATDATGRSTHPWPGAGSAAGSAETATHRGRTPAVPGAKADPAAAQAPRRRVAVAAGALLVAAVVSVLAAVSRRPGEDPPPTPPPQPPEGPAQPIQTNVWNDVLVREPDRLMFPNPRNQNSFSFFPDTRTYRVDVRDDAVILFGKIDRVNYQIQVGITQTRWAGGVGLFFGYHDETFGGQPCRRFQVLHLYQRLTNIPAEKFFVRRSWMRIQDREGTPRIVDQFDAPAVSVGTPHDSREYMLTLEVSRSGLVDVTWDGGHLPLLTTPGANGYFGPADHVGGFGVFLRQSAATFGNARFMLHEGKNP
ncbi:MAG: pknH 2 [Gemmataceae bacterium]|nr:pknH 2 [Gemmataceae bacterium]